MVPIVELAERDQLGMAYVFGTIFRKLASGDCQSLPEMQPPRQVGFEPHVRPPDILPHFPVEERVRRETLSVPRGDLCPFRDRPERVEDDAVQAGIERNK